MQLRCIVVFLLSALRRLQKKNAFDRPIEKVLATVIEVARVVEELEHRRIEGV